MNNYIPNFITNILPFTYIENKIISEISDIIKTFSDLYGDYIGIFEK